MIFIFNTNNLVPFRLLHGELLLCSGGACRCNLISSFILFPLQMVETMTIDLIESKSYTGVHTGKLVRQNWNLESWSKVLQGCLVSRSRRSSRRQSLGGVKLLSYVHLTPLRCPQCRERGDCQ